MVLSFKYHQNINDKKSLSIFIIFIDYPEFQPSQLVANSQEALGSLRLEEAAVIQDNYKSASFKKILLQSKSFESMIIKNTSVCKIIIYYVWIAV